MFHSARIKLTAWYLFIIMLITVLYSAAFYEVATQEIERIINRIEFRHQNPDMPMPERPESGSLKRPSLEDLENSKQKLLVTLIFINGGIFILAGTAGYFLAGRTLYPIKLMIDEQNQFISSASHELRTPIATLRAEMEGSLLEKNISDKKARELITSNLEELGTLQDLSNNLLSLAQVHNMSPKQYMEEVSLLEVLTIAEKKVCSLSKKKHISIKVPTTDATIPGDKKNLIQACIILLDNAIKYSNERTTITIDLTASPQVTTIKVSDEGMGIPQSDIAHIFERFYRSDKSRSQADGYGLGLSIAKKIIETHNGSIQVSSVLEKGTTFTIQLPSKLS